MTGSQSGWGDEPAGFLVLGHAGDAGAGAVADALQRRRDDTRITLVSDLALARANWTHRQGADGTTSRAVLADGRTLTHDGFSLVFNRLRAVLPAQFAGADEANRQYARSETNALLLSWLASFTCPVVPGPAPPGLSPALPSLPGLLACANRAGLPARRLAFSSDARLTPADDTTLAFSEEAAPPPTGLRADPTPRYQLGRDPTLYLEAVAGTPRRLLVVGDDVVGSAPEGLGSSCVRFASECGCDVLALLLDRREPESAGTDAVSRWCLCGADSHPELASRDEAAIVARYLDRRAAYHRARVDPEVPRRPDG